MNSTDNDDAIIHERVRVILECLEVECPACGAQPQHWCRIVRGFSEAEHMHVRRIKARPRFRNNELVQLFAIRMGYRLVPIKS